MAEPFLRDAHAKDADAIAHLLRQLGYPTDAGDLPGRLELMAADGRSEVIVAERSGQMCGVATLHVEQVLNRRGMVGWLTLLVVDEKARGAGVGRALVTEVERRAQDAGCERLTVTTYDRLTAAQAFYEKNGFARTGVRFGKGL